MTPDVGASLGPVLVIGAAGRHGSTGRVVLDELRAAGVVVRALARTDDERAGSLRAQGVDVVIADLRDRSGMLRAIDGCAAAYFTYPVGDGVVEAGAAFASAARECGVRRIVAMSMGPSNAQSPSPLGRAQWLAEEVIQWSGVPCTILRIAALFFENLALLHGDDIREQGQFSNCFGDARVPWIAAEDAARIAVAAFLRPERFPSAVAFFPGVEQWSHAEIADILTLKVGRTVSYQATDAATWASERRARANRPSSVINDTMATHISTLGAVLASGRAPMLPPDPNAIAALIGRRPTFLREFLDRSAGLFSGAR
jgi:uncharacterized protein YbjT (DUF2867 family)